MTQPCLACDAATLLYLCARCTQRLADDLADVAALVDDLDTTTARLHRLGDPGRGGGAARDPVHWAGAETHWNLRNVLGTWARDLAETHHLTLTRADLPSERPTHARHSQTAVERPLPDGGWLRLRHHDPATPGHPRRDTASVAAAFLGAHLDLIRLHPAAGELHDEITDAINNARRVIDRAPVMLAAGPCGALIDHGRGVHRPCDTPLYVHADARTTTTCWSCGAEHDLHDRLADLLDQARDHLVTATVALAWVRLLMGRTIPHGTLRSWASRHRLIGRGEDRAGHPLYRFGDVVTLAAEHVAKHRRSA